MGGCWSADGDDIAREVGHRFMNSSRFPDGIGIILGYLFDYKTAVVSAFGPKPGRAGHRIVICDGELYMLVLDKLDHRRWRTYCLKYEGWCLLKELGGCDAIESDGLRLISSRSDGFGTNRGIGKRMHLLHHEASSAMAADGDRLYLVQAGGYRVTFRISDSPFVAWSSFWVYDSPIDCRTFCYSRKSESLYWRAVGSSHLGSFDEYGHSVRRFQLKLPDDDCHVVVSHRGTIAVLHKSCVSFYDCLGALVRRAWLPDSTEKVESVAFLNESVLFVLTLSAQLWRIELL